MKWLLTLPTRIQFKWWSLQNWHKGYKFSAVQRFRCCDHTTPYHYKDCTNPDKSVRCADCGEKIVHAAFGWWIHRGSTQKHEARP